MNATFIPNTLSMLNLFFGFISILAALRGRFDLSVIFIFIAMVFDMFDGRIARYIRRENPIGKELDSFADLLSFGIAPGVIFYAAFFVKGGVYFKDVVQFSSPEFEYLPYIFISVVAFIFPLLATLRLARYNLTEPTDHFEGLPSTAAGSTIVLLVGFQQIKSLLIEAGGALDQAINFKFSPPVMIVIFLFIAFSMISRVKFGKPQKLFLSGNKNRRLLMLLFNLLIVFLLVGFFKYFLLGVVFVYIIWSYLAAFFRKIKRVSKKKSA